jgi:hypothetical protein
MFARRLNQPSTRSMQDLLNTSWVDAPKVTAPEMLNKKPDTPVIDIRPSAAAIDNTESNKADLEVLRNKKTYARNRYTKRYNRIL